MPSENSQPAQTGTFSSYTCVRNPGPRTRSKSICSLQIYEFVDAWDYELFSNHRPCKKLHVDGPDASCRPLVWTSLSRPAANGFLHFFGSHSEVNIFEFAGALLRSFSTVLAQPNATKGSSSLAIGKAYSVGSDDHRNGLQCILKSSNTRD